jgi:hypothetical protein
MIVNDYVIYRNAADELYHVQGEGVTFDNQQSAIWYCQTGQILTEAEATRAMSIQEQKIQKAETVQEWATQLASLDDFLDVVNAREFGYGQTNEPTDEDLAERGITRDNYRNGMTMLLDLRSFIEGDEEVSISDRSAVIAVLRTDV